MYYPSNRVPGTVGGVPRTPARVVAAGTSTTSTFGLDSLRGPVGQPVHRSAHNDEFVTPANMDGFSAYVEYVHVATDARVPVPARIDPATGACFPLCPLPPDFVPLHQHDLSAGSFLQRLAMEAPSFGLWNPGN